MTYFVIGLVVGLVIGYAIGWHKGSYNERIEMVRLSMKQRGHLK